MLNKINLINMEDFIDNMINNEDLIFFVGSAISKFQPTNISEGKQLNMKLFKALTYDNKDKFLEQYNETFSKFNNTSDEFGCIPLERLISKINSFYKKHTAKNPLDYFNYLKNVKPNMIHKILLDITFKKKNKIILTTNFDCAFENVELKGINIIPITYLNIQNFNNNIYNDYVKIIKLHGSFDNQETVIMSLERESIGLKKELQDLLHKLLENKSICFIGYSGNDIDILPILINIKFKEIYWLRRTKTFDKNAKDKFIKSRVGIFLEKNKTYLCENNIIKIFNHINQNVYKNKYNNLPDNIIEEDVYNNFVFDINTDIPLPYRYLLISDVFIDLLQFKISEKILLRSFKIAKKLWKKVDDIAEFKKQYYHLLWYIYNQWGLLTKAHKYSKKYYKLLNNKKDYDYYEAKLCIINSLIMLRKLKNAKRKLEEIKEELQKNIILNNEEKEKINLNILNYELKIDELAYSINLKLNNGYKFFNDETLKILENVSNKNGDIGSIIDCQLYRLRLKNYKNTNSLKNLIEEYSDFINKYKIIGQVLTYFNILRDKSNILIKQGKYKDAVDIHKFIISKAKLYGNDYQTLWKSHFYLKILYKKLKKYRLYFIHLLIFLKYSLIFISCPSVIIFNKKRFKNRNFKYN